MKLTRQGVRDLGQRRPARVVIPRNCDHRRMRWCCIINGRPCGHLVCPGCDLFWDEGAVSEWR